MNLIDGKNIASAIQHDLARTISALQGRKPGLAFILVGEDPASVTYVRAKKKACAATGIVSTLATFPATIAQSDLLHQINSFNHNPNIDGILVQLPLPPHIDPNTITLAIDPAKDVDGFHPINMGKLLLGQELGFIPCTPLGIQTLLEKTLIPTDGKHVVIVGRSNIVGKPLAALLMQKRVGANATVTIAHSHSEHLPDITRSADILIAAMGRPKFLTKELIRPGTALIDVGISRLPDGKLIGDIDFEAVAPIASHITPVPGGVGPMTIAMLLNNTLLSYQRKHG